VITNYRIYQPHPLLSPINSPFLFPHKPQPLPSLQLIQDWMNKKTSLINSNLFWTNPGKVTESQRKPSQSQSQENPEDLQPPSAQLISKNLQKRFSSNQASNFSPNRERDSDPKKSNSGIHVTLFWVLVILIKSIIISCYLCKRS
jgi:hypothetical protein